MFATIEKYKVNARELEDINQQLKLENDSLKAKCESRDLLVQSDYDNIARKNKEYSETMRSMELKLEEVTKQVAQLQEENAKLKADAQ